MDLIFGLDHSLTAFGLVAVPVAWGLDFRNVARVTLTTSPEDGRTVARRAALARDAVEWMARQLTRAGCTRSKARAVIEGGIFHARKADSVRSQERLAGVVEHEIYRSLGLPLDLAPQQAIRSLFMGPGARGRGIGDAAQALLRAVAPATALWDEAELDAFLVANWALADSGEAFLSCAAPASAPKRRRKAA